MDKKISAKGLRSLIEKEIILHQDHHALLAEESKFITKFNTEKIELITSKRDELYDKMREARDLRLEAVKSLTGSDKVKFTDAVKQNFQGQEARDLLTLAGKLKDAVTNNRRHGFEFNQVVNFALNLVNGTLSLFMSGTKNVSRSYSNKGTIKESFHPTNSRKEGVIKEA